MENPTAASTKVTQPLRMSESGLSIASCRIKSGDGRMYFGRPQTFDATYHKPTTTMAMMIAGPMEWRNLRPLDVFALPALCSTTTVVVMMPPFASHGQPRKAPAQRAGAER